MSHPFSRGRGAVAAGLAASIAALPALAQEAYTGPADTFSLGEITLQVLGTQPVGALTDPLTLTGAKTATAVTEIPQSVSIVSAGRMAETNAAKIDEALRFTSGVQAAPYAYDSDTNWFFLRGFDATASGVFLDGAQLYSYAFGGFYIDPFLIERIEVLKGPSSMLYGASNPGGVVNYVSRLPGGEPGGLAELGIDDEGRRWASVDYATDIDDTLALRFGAKVQGVDGHGMFDDGWDGILSAGFAKRFDHGGVLTATANYTTMEEDHVGGAWLPYFGTVEEVDGFGRFDQYFNSGEPDLDDYDREQWIATAIYRQDLAGGWKLSNTLRFADADIRESSVYAYGYTDFALTPQDDALSLSRLVFEHDTQARVWNNDLNVQNDVDLGPARHRLLFGVDAKYYELDQIQASATGTPLSARDPDYGAAQPASVAYIDQNLEQTQLGVYAQDQISWGDGWLATINARYDNVHTEAGENEATGVAGVNRRDREFSWRAGISKEIGAFTPYLTGGTYFNPQVVNDPAGDEVEPETGRQIEAGVKWSPSADTLVTLAAFEIRREDISQDEFNAATGGYDYFQIGEVRSRGVELEAQGYFTPSISYLAALTLLDMEITDDIDETIVGNTPNIIAENQASFMVGWEPQAVEGLMLRGGMRYYGSSWVDNQNTEKVPEVALFDAGARYDFASGWTANLDITNIADHDYITSCQTAYWCYQGEGRRYALALRRNF